MGFVGATDPCEWVGLGEHDRAERVDEELVFVRSGDVGEPSATVLGDARGDEPGAVRALVVGEELVASAVGGDCGARFRHPRVGNHRQRGGCKDCDDDVSRGRHVFCSRLSEPARTRTDWPAAATPQYGSGRPETEGETGEPAQKRFGSSENRGGGDGSSILPQVHLHALTGGLHAGRHQLQQHHRRRRVRAGPGRGRRGGGALGRADQHREVLCDPAVREVQRREPSRVEDDVREAVGDARRAGVEHVHQRAQRDQDQARPGAVALWAGGPPDGAREDDHGDQRIPASADGLAEPGRAGVSARQGVLRVPGAAGVPDDDRRAPRGQDGLPARA